MTSIVIYEFGGMQPRLGDDILPPEAASDAANCLLLSGELRPLHAPALINEFYPFPTHQEVADDWVSPNPWAGYDAVVQAIGTTIIWVTGAEEITNRGNGNSYIYTDWGWNPLTPPEKPGPIPGRILNFNPHDPLQSVHPDQTWSIQGTTPPAVKLQVGGSEGPTEIRWDDVFNQSIFTSFVVATGPPDHTGGIPFGYYVSWELRATNIYNQWNPPQDGTVNPARCGYRIINGTLPSVPSIFLETVSTTDPNGTSVDIDPRSGEDPTTALSMTMICGGETFFNRTFPAFPFPNINYTESFSAFVEYPYAGILGVSDVVATSDGSLSLVFVWEPDAAFGTIQAEQVFISISEFSIKVLQNSDILITVETTPTRSWIIGQAVAGEEMYLNITWEIIDNNPVEVDMKTYLGGVEVDSRTEFKYMALGTPQVTEIFTGGTSIGSRRAVNAGWAQFVYWQQVITATDVQDLYDARGP